jgi:non-homologous end joining protein Ku
MSALKKGVAFSVGLITVACSINGAVEKAAGNVTVCCGTDPTKPDHDPIRISQVKRCTDCGDVPFDKIRKAREVGDGLVLITDDDITDAKGNADAYKTACALTPHPAATVYARTAPGEKAYYVTPDPGHEVAYDVLRTMIGSHPELAFVGQWTPRSNASQFRVIVRDGCLMMTELVREQAIKSAPVVTAEAPEAMLAMAELVLALPNVVTDYDPETYADHYEDNIQALLATKQVVSAGGTATTTATTPSIPASQQAAMAALEAMLAAAAPPAPKKRVVKVKVPA